MCHLWWVFPSKMVIFHSYVCLPEGSVWWWFHGESSDGAAGKHVDCCCTINQHRPILNGSHLPLGFIISFTRVVDVYSIAIAIPSLKMSTFIPTTGLLYSQIPHHIASSFRRRLHGSQGSRFGPEHPTIRSILRAILCDQGYEVTEPGQ